MSEQNSYKYYSENNDKTFNVVLSCIKGTNKDKTKYCIVYKNGGLVGNDQISIPQYKTVVFDQAGAILDEQTFDLLLPAISFSDYQKQLFTDHNYHVSENFDYNKIKAVVDLKIDKMVRRTKYLNDQLFDNLIASIIEVREHRFVNINNKFVVELNSILSLINQCKSGLADVNNQQKYYCSQMKFQKANNCWKKVKYSLLDLDKSFINYSPIEKQLLDNVDNKFNVIWSYAGIF